MKIAVHYKGKRKTSFGQEAKIFNTAMTEA